MIEGRRGARFAPEAFQSLAVSGESLGQELERHKATQPGVLSLVEHTQAAPAQLFGYAIMGNRCADHGVYRRVYPAPIRMAGRSRPYILFSENLGGEL